MGHWEQIGVENRKERERRAKWPRWRREVYRHGNAAIGAAGWVVLAAIGLWAFWSDLRAGYNCGYLFEFSKK